MTPRPPNRRGYALVMVMLFVVLFAMVMGVAWRRIASALRIEHCNEVRRQCDKGSLQAAAAAMAFLEARLRWDAGVAKLDGSESATASYKKRITADDGTSTWHTIVFTRQDAEGKEWLVDVTAESSEPSSLSALPTSPP